MYQLQWTRVADNALELRVLDTIGRTVLHKPSTDITTISRGKYLPLILTMFHFEFFLLSSAPSSYVALLLSFWSTTIAFDIKSSLHRYSRKFCIAL